MKSMTLLAAVLVVTVLGLSSCCCGKGATRGPAVELFNGRDLSGWRHVLADPSVPREQVWQVQNGAIVCRGEPLGFIHSEQEFTNFRLAVEYRWAPGKEPGNSGLFSRVNGPTRALPRCVEVQLKHGNAGDLLGLQGLKLAPNQSRFFHIDKHEVAGDIDGVKHLENAEKPAGEWNRVECLAQGATYTVWVNGKRVNRVTGVETCSGAVGLQSEGGEIHFRRVTLTPLP